MLYDVLSVYFVYLKCTIFANAGTFFFKNHSLNDISAAISTISIGKLFLDLLFFIGRCCFIKTREKLAIIPVFC